MSARPRTPSENGSTGYYSHSPYHNPTANYNNNTTHNNNTVASNAHNGSFDSNQYANAFSTVGNNGPQFSGSGYQQQSLHANAQTNSQTQNVQHTYRHPTRGELMPTNFSTMGFGGAVAPTHSQQSATSGVSVSSHGTSSAHRSRKRKSDSKHEGASRDFLGIRTGEGNSQSGDSSNGSIGENLPLCPDDSNCSLINDRSHQHRFAHTCRLFPCYHGHIKRHAKMFRHADGQIAVTNSTGNKSKLMALASVNFASISPDAPNATRLTVSSKDVAYDIYGDWNAVKVHTFKRYLHQVFAVEPRHQQLVIEDGGLKKVMDDDLESVQSYVQAHPKGIIVVNDSSAGVSERERQKIREAIVSEL